MKYEDIPEVIRDKMNLDELKFGNGYCLKKDDKIEKQHLRGIIKVLRELKRSWDYETKE